VYTCGHALLEVKSDSQGATTLEYALIAGLVLVTLAKVIPDLAAALAASLSLTAGAL
jgi:Flp pilus assembly pilin Flp